jgi:hypothetical protein
MAAIFQIASFWVQNKDPANPLPLLIDIIGDTSVVPWLYVAQTSYISANRFANYPA